MLTASWILKELRMFSEIDNQRCIVDILQRVPSYIRNAWRAKAPNERHEHDCYPDFSEFVTFIDRKATESLDPVYGNDCMKQNKTRNSATACNTSANSSNIGLQRPCVICQANHRLFNCDSFKSMKPQARFDTVKSHKICFLCLLPGHSSSVCRRTYRCSVPNCGKKHSKFIHVDTRESRSDVTPTGSNDTCPSVPSGSNASANIDNNKSHVYLPIVPVTCNGRSHIFHALLDSGSTNSFVSESLAKCLQLSTRETNYYVSTLASNTQVNRIVSLQLGPLDGAQPVKLNALVVPDIPTRHRYTDKYKSLSPFA